MEADRAEGQAGRRPPAAGSQGEQPPQLPQPPQPPQTGSQAAARGNLLLLKTEDDRGLLSDKTNKLSNLQECVGACGSVSASVCVYVPVCMSARVCVISSGSSFTDLIISLSLSQPYTPTHRNTHQHNGRTHTD